MKIIEFKECNTVYAKDQPQYLPLPAHKTKDGVVTSCWGFNLKERLVVLFTGRVFLQTLTFNNPLQPLKMSVTNPISDNKAVEPTHTEYDENDIEDLRYINDPIVSKHHF